MINLFFQWYKKLLTILVWIFLVSSMATATMRKGPYLIYPGSNTQMQVLWQIDGSVTCSFRWGGSDSYSDGTVTSLEYNVVSHQHEYMLENLTPSTIYHYEIEEFSGGIYTGTFRAAAELDASQLKFIAYGDSRTWKNSDWMGYHNWVCDAMKNAILNDPEYQSLILHVGDFVYHGRNEWDWDNQYFSREYTNSMWIQGNMPVNGCKGNHETYPTSSYDNVHLYREYFPYPYETTDSYYWSFDYGPAHFTIVDQYTNYFPGSEQYNWLSNDLSQTTKKWKFVVFHEPGWSVRYYENNTNVQEYLQPLFEQYKVDIVFCGHNHCYARCVTNGITHITTAGGGAYLRPVDIFSPGLITATSTFHFCKISIDNTRLDFIAETQTGIIIDEFSLFHVPEPVGFLIFNSIFLINRRSTRIFLLEN